MSEKDNDRKDYGKSVPAVSEIFGGLGWLFKAIVIFALVALVVIVLVQVLPDLADNMSRAISRGLRPIFSGSDVERFFKTGLLMIFIAWVIKCFTRRH
ncbi:hypothetical protein ACFL43_00465 [Thermodesulfobacteriota bacterium]